MKWFAIVPLILIAMVAAYFSVLGMKSRSGAPPGLVDGQLQKCGPEPNSVCSAPGNDSAHTVAPLPLIPVAELTGLIEQAGGVVVIRQEGYIASEFRSGLFGFVDDVELLVDPQAQRLHVRSASRVGYSDMGVNRERVAELRALIERQR